MRTSAPAGVAGAGVDASRDLRKELFGEAHQLVHARIARAVVHVPAVAFALDETAVLEAGEVVGDVGLTQARGIDHVTDAPRSVAEGLEDREARGVGEASEQLGLELRVLGGCGQHDVNVSIPADVRMYQARRGGLDRPVRHRACRRRPVEPARSGSLQRLGTRIDSVAFEELAALEPADLGARVALLSRRGILHLSVEGQELGYDHAARWFARPGASRITRARWRCGTRRTSRRAGRVRPATSRAGSWRDRSGRSVGTGPSA